MIPQSIEVIIAMPHYWVVGQMPMGGLRLQDLLARTNTDFISISEAHVFPNESPKSARVALTELLIPKKQILCITTSKQEHEAPQKRLFNLQPRDQSKVVLMVDNYLVEGLAHLPKTATSVAYSLFRDCGLFFPVTDAVVSSGVASRIRFPFLLINSQQLRTVGLAKTSNQVAEPSRIDEPPASDVTQPPAEQGLISSPEFSAAESVTA